MTIGVLVTPRPGNRKRAGGWFVCRFDLKGWRCGFCLRGLIVPRLHSQCRVCGATVVRSDSVVEAPQ